MCGILPHVPYIASKIPPFRNAGPLVAMQPGQSGLLTKDMRKLISLLTLATLFTGCQYDPYADKYTVVEPTDKDVTGIYEFDFQTVDYSVDNKQIEKSRPRIRINSDNTYMIERLPYFKEVGSLTYKFDKQVSISGTWKIEEVGTVDFGDGKLKKHWGLVLESAPDELRYAGLMGTEKPDGIIFGFGDPDSGDVMTLNKK